MSAYLLPIRVTPKSSRNQIEGWISLQGEPVLKMHVTAPPEKGQANAAVLQLLARVLGIAQSRLSLTCGATSRRKRVKIEDWSLDLEKKLPPNPLSQTLF